MTSRARLLSIALVGALAATLASSSLAGSRDSSVLDILTSTDGAQAVTAAALVVDEAAVLDFSLAELLADRRAGVILLAPTNDAFEKLLGLEPGTLDGLSIAEIKDALPSLLPTGVGPEEVAAILLKHTALPERMKKRSSSAKALLSRGVIQVADGSELSVGLGGGGIEINYEATITRENFFAKNGVVHFIDTVILDGLL